ncbi:Actin- protein 6 [Coemansia sp. Benny D115]|nr:Actin- protein 6 [Coemansia sp. Benny D115]
MRSLVVDNGSHTIKAGYRDDADTPLTMPNAVARTRRTQRVYVGDLIDQSSDLAGLYYRTPFERGFLVHWDAQLVIWDRLFSDAVLKCNPQDTHLTLSEPMFNFSRVQRTTDEIVFEEYGFHSLVRAPSASLCARTLNDSECSVVVDLGHACSYAVPLYQGRAVRSAVRRVDVGGRLLTNYLKELVSFRHWDMMDETYIMSAVKHRSCYVANDFYDELERARRDPQSCLLEYVLPDFAHTKQGFVLGQEPQIQQAMSANGLQVLRLGNERFAVPEALFHPEDVGLEQGGVHEMVFQAIQACAPELRPLMYANVQLAGGQALVPGIRDRLERELRALAPADVTVCVSVDESPGELAWRGGILDELHGMRLARSEYLENGADRALAHFNKYI